jgi:hypothetical protein
VEDGGVRAVVRRKIGSCAAPVMETAPRICSMTKVSQLAPTQGCSRSGQRRLPGPVRSSGMSALEAIESAG